MLKRLFSLLVLSLVLFSCSADPVDSVDDTITIVDPDTGGGNDPDPIDPADAPPAGRVRISQDMPGASIHCWGWFVNERGDWSIHPGNGPKYFEWATNEYGQILLLTTGGVTSDYSLDLNIISVQSGTVLGTFKHQDHNKMAIMIVNTGVFLSDFEKGGLAFESRAGIFYSRQDANNGLAGPGNPLTLKGNATRNTKENLFNRFDTIFNEFGQCAPPDSDGDGVPDMQDDCPDTPSGVAVDNDGCPV